MKKLINILLGFWLGLGITALFAENAEPVDLCVPANANYFQVSLPANPTTGYQWVLKQYDAALILLIRSQYQPSSSELVGASGNTVFYFKFLQKAVKDQQSKLGFEYVRTWEHKKANLKMVTIKFK